MIPIVIEESGRGERAFDIYSRLLRERIIFLGEAVTSDSANRIVAQMLFLEAEDPKRISISTSIHPAVPFTTALVFLTPCSTSSLMCTLFASDWRRVWVLFFSVPEPKVSAAAFNTRGS